MWLGGGVWGKLRYGAQGKLMEYETEEAWR